VNRNHQAKQASGVPLQESQLTVATAMNTSIKSQPAEAAVTEKMSKKLLVPAAEAAQMLSIGRSTFWNKVKENKLPQPMRFAGVTRWRVSDLQDFVAGLASPTFSSSKIDQK